MVPVPSPQAAGWFFWHHLFLVVLLQGQAYVVYQSPHGQRRRALLRWLSLLPWAQAENIAAAVLIAVLAGQASRSVWSGWLVAFGLAALESFLVLSQLYYRNFFEHFRPSRVQRREYYDWRLLAECVRASWDGWLIVNGMVVAVGLAGGMALLGVPRLAPAVPSGKLLAVLLGLAACGVPLRCWGVLGDLTRHPVAVLFGDLLVRKSPSSSGRTCSRRDAFLSAGGPTRFHGPGPVHGA